MSPTASELRRIAVWTAALTVPLFLLGLLLFDVHGVHIFGFTAPLGLAMILPWAWVHDSGLSYRLGLGAIPLIVLGQWAWFLIPVAAVRALARRTSTALGSSRKPPTRVQGPNGS